MGSKGTNTTTQTQAPNPQAGALYGQLLNQAQSVAATPYTPYGGELTAPVNQQQQTGIANINANADYAQPYLGTALQYAQNAAQPITQAQIQQYESPYTQQVVNATQNQFNNQNAQQQQQLTGNAISQNALGGNRSAVAAAQLAGQQQLAQAPVIANLENQGYTTGLNTALTEQQALASGAANIGTLGIAGQNAGLSGANAQIGAGSLQQQTQQAQDTAAYQQFMNQMAYPFQTTQWLAGLGTGVGSQMGGTSTTTAPAPSMFGQIAGGLMSGVGLLGGTGAFGSTGYLNPNSTGSNFIFSDRRAKENIQRIGKLNDGQHIYRFNYKGDPTTHVGLIAQDVEKEHPEAVHSFNGVKAVDYDVATRDAVQGVAGRDVGGGVFGYDNGGGVGGGSPFGQEMAAMPYSGGSGWVPKANIATGNTMPRGVAPAAPQNNFDITKQGNNLGIMAKAIKEGFNTPGTVTDIPNSPNAGIYIGDPSQAGFGPTYGGQVGLSASADNPSIYALGGAVGLVPNRSFADGGSPDDIVPPDDAVIGQDNPINMPSNGAVQAWRNGVDSDRVGGLGATALAYNDPASGDGVPWPRPRTRGLVAADGTVNPNADGTQNGDATVTAPAAVSAGVAPSKGPNIDWSGDSKLWPSLMAAGLGMMASRSPFAGVAVGEGGLQGLSTYGDLAKQEAAQKLSQSELDQKAKNLSAEADRHARDYQLNLSKATEESRHNKATESEASRLHFVDAMKPVQIGVGPLGPEYAVRDPVNGSYRKIDMQSGKLGTPLGSPQNAPGGQPPLQGSSEYPLRSVTTTPMLPDKAAPPEIIKTAFGENEDISAPLRKVFANDQANLPGTRPEVLEADTNLNPEQKSRVKAIAEGRMPALATGRNNYLNNHMMDMVLAYNPAYDATTFPRRQRTETFYSVGTQGGGGQNIVSINRWLAHTGSLLALAEKMDMGDYTTLNDLKNTLARKGLGSKELQDQLGAWDVNAKGVAGEAAKVFAGSNTALSDRAEWEHILSSGTPLHTMREKLRQAAEMGEQALTANVAGYNEGMRTNHNPREFLTPRSNQILEALKSGTPISSLMKTEGTVSGNKAPEGGTPASPQIDPRDAAALQAHKDNPAAKAAIDKKYGPGTADRLLGVQ